MIARLLEEWSGLPGVIKRLCKSNGFTLIELTVVLLIIGLVTVTTGPLTSKGIAHFNLHSSSHLLAADIRELQQLALCDNSSQYLITFFTEHYRMTKSSYPSPKRIGTTYLPAGVRVEHTNFPENVLRFSDQGSPSPHGGTVTLYDQITGQRKYIIIASITGRVRVSDQKP